MCLARVRGVPLAGEAPVTNAARSVSELVTSQRTPQTVARIDPCGPLVSGRSKQRESKPHISDDRILFDGLAIPVHDPEGVLRLSAALVGRPPIPPHRFGNVPLNATAGSVVNPEAELCSGASCLSRNTCAWERLP